MKPTLAKISAPPTRLNLEGKHAAKFSAVKVGSKVKMALHGVKSSHFKNSDGQHSVGIDVNRVDPMEEAGETSADDEKKGY